MEKTERGPADKDFWVILPSNLVPHLGPTATPGQAALPSYSAPGTLEPGELLPAIGGGIPAVQLPGYLAPFDLGQVGHLGDGQVRALYPKFPLG
jgi:hypothetical protein